MRTFLLLCILSAPACTLSRADESRANVRAVEISPGLFVTPFDQPCGNGNTVCADGQLCLNGDCLTLCGSHECFAEIEAAYDASGICPAERPVVRTMAKWRALKERR